jgi:hypothetical protein
MARPFMRFERPHLFLCHADDDDAFRRPESGTVSRHKRVFALAVHTPVFDFSRQSVAVNHYYFYVQDRDWGPALSQNRHVSAVSGEAVSQRSRVGQTMVAAPPHSLREPS